MSEATTIAAMMKSVEHGPAWHGPSMADLLKGLSAEEAAQKPIVNAHSIWEILLHVNAWQDYLVSVEAGGAAAFLEDAADWPPVPESVSDSEWETTQRRFEGGSQEIRELLAHFDDARMRQNVPGRDFPFKVLLHGLVHHNLYHSGQIALLRKALGKQYEPTDARTN